MKEIYLDAHASTQVDPIVLESMVPFFTKYYANGNHKNGWRADNALKNARLSVAQSINAYPKEIYFTSGATEAICTGLIGLTKKFPNKKHIVTQITEHPAVLQTIGYLETQGYRVTYLNVSSTGLIDIHQLRTEIQKDTLVVAIMLANNEIGTIQPIDEIGQVCKQNNTLFFCDVTQGVGWYDLDVKNSNIDMASISAHKIYGPKGIGAFYSRIPAISPLLYGGNQERGLRSGTVNIPGAVGLGVALKLYDDNREKNISHLQKMRSYMETTLLKEIDGTSINGGSHRHPGNINISIGEVYSEQLMAKLSHLTFSNSSACNGSSTISHVLSAIGLSEKQCKESIRIGLSRFNTFDEVKMATQQIVRATQTIRKK